MTERSRIMKDLFGILAELKAHRLLRNWRQEDVARRAGMSRSGVADYENGRVGQPDLEFLDRVAAVYGFRIGIYLEVDDGEVHDGDRSSSPSS